MVNLILVAGSMGLLIGVALALLLPGRIASAARAALSDRLEAVDRGQERIDRAVREELGKNRGESAETAARLREEVRLAQKDAADSTLRALGVFGERLDGLAKALEQRLAQVGESSEKRLEGLRATVDERLAKLQDDNGKRLDEMRRTVDEKLEGTLEKRLGQSFKLVSDQLESVARGLGEMRSLASGVGDLKKVLTNVKVRGTWGEIQLGNLLEQMLAPEQYVRNAAPRRESGERVEFAVRLPGPDGAAGEEVLLPIDAKFPLEDYQRLVEASERGDAEALEAASRALEARIRGCAEDIRDKYLSPPRTTDFGILYLPTEGLFAEVVRRTALVERLQRECKVTVAGPTTLSAMLNSLQMGFRTLAIQKRSAEVWQVLGTVKAEFGKVGDYVAKVEKKLQEASNTLQEIGRRGRVIERKLKDVQALPVAEPQRLLPGVPVTEPADEVEAV
ncbi:MAG TPA: DNA recombination protein RmuC [Anaeromyxobacter sp.]